MSCSDPKLLELRLEFRVIVAAILEALEAKGWQPKISNAHRTAAEQLEKVRLGYANPGATNPGAHNWGLACDIVDRRLGWLVSEQAARFFADLGDAAVAAGMSWGGSWFGAGGTRQKPTHKSPWNRWGIGWDPAHVQWPAHEIPEAWRRPFGGSA